MTARSSNTSAPRTRCFAVCSADATSFTRVSARTRSSRRATGASGSSRKVLFQTATAFFTSFERKQPHMTYSQGRDNLLRTEPLRAARSTLPFLLGASFGLIAALDFVNHNYDQIFP